MWSDLWCDYSHSSLPLTTLWIRLLHASETAFFKILYNKECRQISFYARVTILKSHANRKLNSHLTWCYFLWVRGLIASFHIEYDYATSRHSDLQSTYGLYIHYMYISVLYAHIPNNIFIYFCCNKNVKRLTSIDFVMVHPDCGSLATQTLPFSDSWHLNGN